MDGAVYLRNYMTAVRDATAHIAQMRREGHQPFHILGHLDFAKRYAKRFFDYQGPFDDLTLVEEILRNCLSADLIPEINTSTLRNNMPAPMPGAEVIDAYAALGGTSVSLGSDAHTAKYVGSHFDHALDIMRNAGITRLAVFRDGTPRPEQLD
jgi:histidinol-phosphatase (PHP family)